MISSYFVYLFTFFFFNELVRRCKTKKNNTVTQNNWIEWIEPLSVHGRHPFSMFNCKGEYLKRKVVDSNLTNIAVDLINTDYILVQSYQSLFNQSLDYSPAKHYFFDAGASTFRSSMW